MCSGAGKGTRTPDPLLGNQTYNQRAAARGHRIPGAGDGIRTRDVLLGRNGVSVSSAADEPRLTQDQPPGFSPAYRPGSTSRGSAPPSPRYTSLSSVAPSPACCDPAGTERPAPEHHSQSPTWRRCAGSGGHGSWAGQFDTLLEAKVLVERYNAVRPHSALGYRPPAPETVLSWAGRMALSHQMLPVRVT